MEQSKIIDTLETYHCSFKPVSIMLTYFDSSADIEASTSRLDRGFLHLFINLLRRLRRLLPTSSVTLVGPRALPRRTNLCQHRHTIALSPIRQWVCGSSPNFGSNLSSAATTNKPGAINSSNFCSFGFIFPKELLLCFVPSSVHRSIKWWVRESWIRGCPDGRTMTFGRTPGL